LANCRWPFAFSPSLNIFAWDFLQVSHQA
jgi:hypothetical protein